MTNVSFGSENAPANTNGRPATPEFVPSHVGGHTVRIDVIALKKLIAKLKAALQARR